MSRRSVFLLTLFALTAFAGNSVLARLALVDGAIGVVPFTAIRIASGALVLALLVGARRVVTSGSWGGAAALLGYAALFTLAYLELDTGVGALLLFASVQIAMIGWGVATGERLGLVQLGGLAIALAGLAWLLLPGQSRPDLLSALVMAGSGLCWGIYSLLGRGAGDPTRMTAGNFARATVLGLPLLGTALLGGVDIQLSTSGIGLAILSGAVTSGLGYAVWYAALKGLSATRAGVVQLAVPPLAALGGVLLLGEPLTATFVGASAITLAGIALASLVKPRYANSK